MNKKYLNIANRKYWTQLMKIKLCPTKHIAFGDLEITGCLIDTWTSEKNKTRRQNVFGSRVVAGTGMPHCARRTGGGRLYTWSKPEQLCCPGFFIPARPRTRSVRPKMKKPESCDSGLLLCRRSGEKVECKSNSWTRSDWVNYCPVRPSNGMNFLFGIFLTHVWNHV